MAPRTSHFDLLIAGGGLAGLTLAAALAGTNLRIGMIDAGNPRAPVADGRTTALAHGARNLYGRIGLWPALAPKACPILDIRVLNGGRPGLLDFASGEIGTDPFGYIVENDDLKAALTTAALRERTTTLFANAAITDAGTDANRAFVNLADGRALSAELLIAADGRNSFCRTQLGIPVRRHDYGQTATICNIAHTEPHHHLALENFFPGGPFAVLPMTDGRHASKCIHRSSIVWSEATETAQALRALPMDEFTAHLAHRIGDWLGVITVLTRPATYPLGLVHAVRYSKGRALLLGDAAHGIHPIAGQGFNLTIRDIVTLCDLIRTAVAHGQAPGGQALLAQYEKLRRLDNIGMIAATHGLDRLFSNSLVPLARLRGIGLSLVNRMTRPRHFLMRQAMGASRTDSHVQTPKSKRRQRS